MTDALEETAPAQGDGATPLLERIATSLAEGFLLPVRCSPRPAGWIAARAILALPREIRGRERTWLGRVGGRDVSVLTIGREERLHPTLRRIFERLEPLQAPAVSRSLARPPRLAAGADLVAMEIHPWFAGRFRRAGWRILPHAVRWAGALASIPPPRQSTSLRSDLRLVRKHGYRLQAGESRADWDEFYSQMVVPLARRRWGREAWIPSPRLVRRFAARGKLLFILRDGVRVAGTCVIPIRETLWVPLVGLLDGDPRLLREGALVASDALVFGWARDEGFALADWGQTSPFLHDGLHRYKRKWGFTPVPEPVANLAALQLRPDCATLREAFASRPVLVHGEDGLEVFDG